MPPVTCSDGRADELTALPPEPVVYRTETSCARAAAVAGGVTASVTVAEAPGSITGTATGSADQPACSSSEIVPGAVASGPWLVRVTVTSEGCPAVSGDAAVTANGAHAPSSQSRSKLV